MKAENRKSLLFMLLTIWSIQEVFAIEANANSMAWESCIIDTSTPAPSVLINELMQSNIDALMLNGDLPDSWVELYNPTDEDIDIHGYGIGQSDDFAEAYIISLSYKVQSHGYQLILCDKVNKYQHTDFRLESTDGGELFLFDSTGRIIDHLQYPAMPAPDIAYGRLTDGAEEWQYELRATPGESNSGECTSRILPNPVFSVEGGIMLNPVELEITMPTDENLPDDTRIYVTLDGQEPTLSSPSFTQYRLVVDRTVTVRAKLLSAEALPCRSLTHSYIFHPREAHIPIVSLVTDSDYLYSEEHGILLGGLPLGTGNCYKDWRRPVNVEFFAPHETHATINQLAEVAVGGVGSRIYSQKSLNLYANKRFGKKRFKGQFWPEDKPWLTKVKSMKLRNGGNRCLDTRFEDALAQRIFGHWVEGLEYQAYQAVIGYINGQYCGIYGLRERTNKDYLESNLGLDGDSVEVCENFVGTSPAYADMLAVINDDTSTLADFEALMDVEEFATYMCCQFYASNEDFPHNNVYMWRKLGQDEKWHFLLKDLDHFSVSRLGTNYMNWLMAEGSEGKWVVQPDKHALIQRLMRMAEFRDLFLDKMSAMLGDFLHADVTLPLVSLMRQEIEGEIESTFATFSEGISPETFASTIEQRLIPFCQKRPRVAYQHLSTYFNLGALIPMTVDNSSLEVSLNGVRLTQAMFDGQAWNDRRFVLDSGDNTKGWLLSVSYSGGVEWQYELHSRQVKLIPSQDLLGCQQLSFSLIDIDPDSSISVIDHPLLAPITIYGIDGIRRNGLDRQPNIVRFSDGSARIVLNK